LSTPSGKIDIFSQAIASFRYDDCPSYPSWLASDEWLSAPGAAQWSLHLITHQPADKLHSQMDVGKVSLAHKVSGAHCFTSIPVMRRHAVFAMAALCVCSMRTGHAWRGRLSIPV